MILACIALSAWCIWQISFIISRT